jgi:hypothetical protein
MTTVVRKDSVKAWLKYNAQLVSDYRQCFPPQDLADPVPLAVFRDWKNNASYVRQCLKQGAQPNAYTCTIYQRPPLPKSLILPPATWDVPTSFTLNAPGLSN